MKNQTIPNLPFSIGELDSFTSDGSFGIGLMYIGLTTTGTYMFFDQKTGSVYRYNINTGYLRRNSHYSFDGRNQLVTKHRVQPDELLEALEHYVPIYRRTLRKRKESGRKYSR